MSFEEDAGRHLPEGFRRGDRLYGALKEPDKFLCGGWTECEEKHSFLSPVDVIVLNEAIPLDEFRESHHWRQDLEDHAVEHQTLYVGKTVVVPTMLGLWFEDTSVN